MTMESLRVDFMDDLRRLRVLREFRERETVTATAKALHLTPSAVSQQLAGLGRDVGFPVIERRGRRVALTSRGRRLLDHADRVFAHIERARHDLGSFDESLHGTVTIGASATAMIGIVPEVLERAIELPGVTIRVQESDPPDVFDQLDAGRVEIAIAVNFTGSPGAGDPRYWCVDLGEDILDVALPVGHRLAGHTEVSLAQLAEESWITGSADGCCAVLTLTACAAAGFNPQVRHRIDDWHALTLHVAQGHGVALIPRLAQRDLPDGLVVRPVANGAPRRHLTAAVRQGAQDSPLIAEVLELVKEASATALAG